MPLHIPHERYDINDLRPERLDQDVADALRHYGAIAITGVSNDNVSDIIRVGDQAAMELLSPKPTVSEPAVTPERFADLLWKAYHKQRTNRPPVVSAIATMHGKENPSLRLNLIMPFLNSLHAEALRHEVVYGIGKERLTRSVNGRTKVRNPFYTPPEAPQEYAARIRNVRVRGSGAILL